MSELTQLDVPGVIQTIQYRNTGVNLRVRPVINSGNRLDLEVSQEVSSVAAGETGIGSNPIISNRKIETKLSLRDGSTVLLGGLISRDTSTTNAGVPLLKDIPGLGALFRNRQDSINQTELLVMITPYVINDDFESEEITAALHKINGYAPVTGTMKWDEKGEQRYAAVGVYELRRGSWELRMRSDRW